MTPAHLSSNACIVAAAALLYKDMMRLYVSLNTAVVNLLEVRLLLLRLSLLYRTSLFLIKILT